MGTMEINGVYRALLSVRKHTIESIGKAGKRPCLEVTKNLPPICETEGVCRIKGLIQGLCHKKLMLLQKILPTKLR